MSPKSGHPLDTQTPLFLWMYRTSSNSSPSYTWWLQQDDENPDLVREELANTHLYQLKGIKRGKQTSQNRLSAHPHQVCFLWQVIFLVIMKVWFQEIELKVVIKSIKRNILILYKTLCHLLIAWRWVRTFKYRTLNCFTTSTSISILWTAFWSIWKAFL